VAEAGVEIKEKIGKGRREERERRGGGEGRGSCAPTIVIRSLWPTMLMLTAGFA